MRSRIAGIENQTARGTPPKVLSNASGTILHKDYFLKPEKE